MALQRVGPKTTLKVLGDVVRYRLHPSFRHLILHVTNVCNMRCQHCFVNFEEKPNDLTFEEIEAVARDVNDLIWLDIGGGEPCLRKDLAAIVGLFRAREISIPTNGWFPERIARVAAAIEAQAPGRLIVTVSLDGFEDTHDEMRMAGSFKKVHETIRRLREIDGLRVKVNTVLCERNVGEILDFMRYVRDLGVDYQSLLLLRGTPINPSYKLPAMDILRKIGDQLPAILEGYEFGRKGFFRAVLRNYQAVKWETQLRTLEQQTQVIPCLGGQIHLVVYANGEVAPCEILPSVGSIRNAPLRDIVNGRAWAEAVAGIRRKECHCTHDCNQQENILFSPRTYPRLLGL
ncbi:MAG TPA: radical SAM protein [Candidatus Deferrimicrobiaceae bacterium]|nr:radical SAM protein [Candidatus Deferrimicrobiaceae bacterium]